MLSRLSSPDISFTLRFSCHHESIQPRSSQMLPPPSLSLPPTYYISFPLRFSCHHESIQPRSSQMLPPVSLFPLQDLFVASSVDFVALRPATLLNLTTASAAGEKSTSTAESTYPMVHQILQRPEWQSDELRRFLATGTLPTPGHATTAENYDYEGTWSPAPKQVSGTIDLFGSAESSVHVSTDYGVMLSADIAFRQTPR
ncbi:hypothetical protein PAPYR_13424 [Paratrimastix pyriformis]|uniref:Uncharacterized protein n=1 Tax=Paratrimastix pyriformis TaxID=342808 RepID=A0ABQ8U6L8_9EUKA|nr:hypothetical protein PAPYR_13424 [Paratrimastix pyriformis]